MCELFYTKSFRVWSQRHSFRVVLFAMIVILNFWMSVRFISFHLRRRHEKFEAIAQRKRLAAERRTKSGLGGKSASSSDDDGVVDNSPRAENSGISSQKGKSRKKAE